VEERARRLGPAGLFAIETRPERVGPGLPVVVFLNAATDHHVGPNRLWVQLARRWADLGFRSVRIDLSGIGDSPTRPGRDELVARSADAFDDVREVVEAIGEDDPSNVVLVGLCSGGYQALESALDLKARGALVVNPTTVFTPPELDAGGAMDPRRRICRPTPTAATTYRRLVPSRLRRRLQPVMWRVFAVPRPHQDAGRWPSELVGGGPDALVVCGQAESRQLVGGTRREWERLEGSGRLRLEVVERLNPGLLPVAQRDEVAERFTEHLVARHLHAQAGRPVRR
jgi:pimeloyl-ACP methyl ester carboxylesterase